MFTTILETPELIKLAVEIELKRQYLEEMELNDQYDTLYKRT